MFAMSALAEGASLPPIALVDGKPDLRALPDEYRFAVPGVAAVRLPKQLELVDQALTDAREAAPLLWAALVAPIHRVPLLATSGERAFALVVGTAEDGELTTAEARLTIRQGARRYDQSELTAVSFNSARTIDAVSERLEQLWLDADPAARSATSSSRAIWLGGNPARLLERGEDRIRAVCAVFGLHGEIVADASRYVRQVGVRIGSQPPGYLIVWRPHAFGVESLVANFQDATEGEVIELLEPSLEDAILELRWALCDRGLDGKAPPEPEQPSKPKPVSGEERFYIKHFGSKVGDRMIEILDCGHGQWGSDKRAKAPRAFKGIIASVGVEPQAIFKCAKCSKNRWRARF